VTDLNARAFRLGPGEGRRLWAFGDLMIMKLTAEQSSGRVFIMEQHVPRHRRAPGRHVHEIDDQSWFVIAGRGRWFIGDDMIEAGPGDFVHGPHGVAHAFSADSDDLHVLVITAPAGLEGLFAAMGVDATELIHPPADVPDAPNHPDLARRYGTKALGPEPRWTPSDSAAP
jgi:quercetin dioxygenase-like cupin family protein